MTLLYFFRRLNEIGLNWTCMWDVRAVKLEPRYSSISGPRFYMSFDEILKMSDEEFGSLATTLQLEELWG